MIWFRYYEKFYELNKALGIPNIKCMYTLNTLPVIFQPDVTRKTEKCYINMSQQSRKCIFLLWYMILIIVLNFRCLLGPVIVQSVDKYSCRNPFPLVYPVRICVHSQIQKIPLAKAGLHYENVCKISRKYDEQIANINSQHLYNYIFCVSKYNGILRFCLPMTYVHYSREMCK